jgi:hypothetical protein
MIQTVNNSEFHNAFNRMDRGNQFSYEALNLIYEYLEELDPNMELDVISICCDTSESSVEQIIRDYSIDCDGVEDDEIDAHVIAYLDDHTTVVNEVQPLQIDEPIDDTLPGIDNDVSATQS